MLTIQIKSIECVYKPIKAILGALNFKFKNKIPLLLLILYNFFCLRKIIPFLKHFWDLYKQVKNISKIPKLLQKAKEIVVGIKRKTLTTRYSHDNRVDVHQGFYEVDCTGFVNHILISQKLVKALREVQDFIETERIVPKPKDGLPWPLHYTVFFDSEKPKKNWFPFTNAYMLEPGDVIAYTSNDTRANPSSEDGQHIMIVAGRYIPIPKSRIWVPIFDSTRKPHGHEDKRGREGGIGVAIIELELNLKGKPGRLKWYPGSKFSLNRNITMARVIDS